MFLEERSTPVPRPAHKAAGCARLLGRRVPTGIARLPHGASGTMVLACEKALSPDRCSAVSRLPHSLEVVILAIRATLL